MALFRRSPPPVEPAYYGGEEPLEVKGEATYQDALAAVAGPKTEEGYYLTVVAVLSPDPTNLHDPNAVAVLVEGRQVGWIGRDDAARVSEIVRRLEAEEGRPVAVAARILGGWDRGGGDEGNYGIWLYYDSARFR